MDNCRDGPLARLYLYGTGAGYPLGGCVPTLNFELYAYSL